MSSIIILLLIFFLITFKLGYETTLQFISSTDSKIEVIVIAVIICIAVVSVIISVTVIVYKILSYR